MEDGVEWIVAWYEFGGVMQISSACLRELPLFKMGIPPPLRLADVASDAKRRRSASTTIILPFVQSPSKFYDLIGEYRYSARETVQDERLRKFYGAVDLPDHFQPGCVDVQLEAEATPLHMTRHAMNLLEFMHGKHRFSAELLPNEYMPGVRRKTLELLLFDDGSELDEAESGEYYEAMRFYRAIDPVIVVTETDDLKITTECRPLDQRDDSREQRIRSLVSDILSKNEVQPHFPEASKVNAKCKCIRGSYSLSTTRPRHTVNIIIHTTDSYGQRNASSNTVYSFEYLNGRTGSTLTLTVNGTKEKQLFLTPIVVCEDDVDHRVFVKSIAMNEMQKLLPDGAVLKME